MQVAGMSLFRFAIDRGRHIALLAGVDLTCDSVASAAFERMSYVARASGRDVLPLLLRRAIDDDGVAAVVLSLNSNCVFDDELPARLQAAVADPAPGCEWALLAATGLMTNHESCSVTYPSASPRLFSTTTPKPVIDCGLDLFALQPDFLRAHLDVIADGRIQIDSFAQWCILTGYLEGRVSIFRPELSIGIDGSERGRDHVKHASAMRAAFSGKLADDSIASLSGVIQLTPDLLTQDDSKNPREKEATAPRIQLAELVRKSILPCCTRMSLSIVTRTQFRRPHLIRRLLTTITRARSENVDLEIILSTDIDRKAAEAAFDDLRAKFKDLNLKLQVNSGEYGQSRVDNLLGGIFAAKHDYVAIVDDDDFIHLDAFETISTARFVGDLPLLVMSTEVRDEKWVETSRGRWVLESSRVNKTYWAVNYRQMFSGVNQLPVCALIAPREWLQRRIAGFKMRHDLSEDYTLYLLLLSAPDLPQLLAFADVFCIVSSRDDGSNTITMTDRRPWVRDITLFLHDLCVAAPPGGLGVIQLLEQASKLSPGVARSLAAQHVVSDEIRRAREIALLKAEIEHLRAQLTEH